MVTTRRKRKHSEKEEKPEAEDSTPDTSASLSPKKQRTRSPRKSSEGQDVTNTSSANVETVKATATTSDVVTVPGKICCSKFGSTILL